MFDLIKKFEPGKIAAVAAGFVAVVAILIFLSVKLSAPPMSLLYTGLSSEDSALIISRLEAMQETYQSSNDGKDISVAVSKVLSLRMRFAEEGIPQSGSIVGYEIFDKSDGLGTSQFVNNVNLLRALEGELSRTVSSISSVESARIHLVLPKKEMFTKAATEPSASIVLKLKGGQTLSKQEVAGISHIIATAVPGLRTDNITILDTSGRPLKLATGDDTSLVADGASDFQKVMEEKYQVMLESLIEKSVGVGKVKANVAAEINFDREVVNSEVYDPDGQVIRSRKVSEDKEEDKDEVDSLGVATNIPGAQSGEKQGNRRSRDRTDEITNYEISKTITNKITESGRIKKLSIAILVDGTYTPKQPDSSGVVEYSYNPRPPEELDKLKLLAASAVGLDPARGDKIEVINLQFSDEFSALPQPEKPLAWLRNKVDNIVQTVVIGLVIILIMLLIVKPVITRLLETRAALAEEKELEARLMSGESIATVEQEVEVPARSGPEMSDDEYLEILLKPSSIDRKKINLVRYLNDLVDKHPDETVSIIRAWLYDGK